MERAPRYRIGIRGVEELSDDGKVRDTDYLKNMITSATWTTIKPMEYDHGKWRASDYEPNPIGIGKPLQIRIASACIGPLTGDVLVGSAVRDANLTSAKTVAVNRLLDHRRESAMVDWHASEDGSPLVYYSPRVKERSLLVSLLLEEDLFDESKWRNLVENVASIAGVPAFLAGLGGVSLGTAIVTAGEKIADAAIRVIDQVVDGELPIPLTFDLALSDEGPTEALDAGYVLLYGKTRLEEAARPSGPTGWPIPDLGETERRKGGGLTIKISGDELVVNRANGTLCYASKDDTPVTDMVYVLLHIDGTADESLRSWRASAISADLTDRFLNVRAEENAELTRSVVSAFHAASDLATARDIVAVDKELAQFKDSKGIQNPKLSKTQQARVEALEMQRLELLDAVDDETVREAFEDK